MPLICERCGNPIKSGQKTLMDDLVHLECCDLTPELRRPKLSHQTIKKAAREFLLKNPPYTSFDPKKDLGGAVKEIYENSMRVIDSATFYIPKRREGNCFGWECPECGFDDFPDNSPFDFYVASNKEVYPKRTEWSKRYDYYYGISYWSWTEMHRCPRCGIEFSYGNSSA